MEASPQRTRSFPRRGVPASGKGRQVKKMPLIRRRKKEKKESCTGGTEMRGLEAAVVPGDNDAGRSTGLLTSKRTGIGGRRRGKESRF